MKKFGYRFALIAGVTSLLVSASIAPVSLAKPSGKNVPSLTQTKQTKPSQKIAVLPAFVGGVVLGADTVIKITAIYIGLCGLKTPSDCGKNAIKAINEINAYLKQTGSKVTMTLKQAYDMALKYKTAIVAPPPPKIITPTKKPGSSNNVLKFYRDKYKLNETKTDEEDDNKACDGINNILQNLVNGALSENFQKTREFPEYNIIVCISKKIPNKEKLTTTIKEHIATAKSDKKFHRKNFLSEKSLPLKKTATIYVTNFKKKESFMDVIGKSQVSNEGNGHWWYFFENQLLAKIR